MTKYLQIKTSRKAVWIEGAECKALHYAKDYAAIWKDNTVAVYSEAGKLLARACTRPGKRETEKTRAKEKFHDKASAYMRAKSILEKYKGKNLQAV